MRNKYVNELYRRETYNFERAILKKCIRQKYANISKLRRETNNMKDTLQKTLNPKNFKHTKNQLDTIRKFESNKHSKSLNNKLNFWISKNNIQVKKEKTHDYPYINLSNYQPDTHTDLLLKRGLKYIPETKINIKDSIPKIENAINKLPEDIRYETSVELSKELKQKLKNNNKDIEDYNTLKKLKERKNTTILRTDKTGKIVIMNTDDYKNKMNETIEKLSTEIINKNPNKKLFEITKQIIKEGNWPDNIKPNIQNHAPNNPRMFGTYKDHKTPPTMRPIVSRREGPTYCLEKYMYRIYQSILPTSENALKSSKDFINIIKDFKYDNNYTIVSFDVKDLYPSININKITPTINDAISNHYKDPTIAQTLIRTSNFILNNTYFTFNNNIYKQSKGLPMGSPISGIVAEHKMRTFENQFINDHNEIKLWTRYVDDIFAVIKGDPHEILKKLNNADHDLKFTMETETNNIINYLDIKLIIDKTSNKIETTVYHKPTASNEIISKSSKTPNNYKHAAIISYIDRALTFCSNKELFRDEIKHITNIAKNAGYPKKLIQNILKNRKIKINHIPPAQKQKDRYTYPIPFNKGIAVKLKRIAAKHNIHIPIKPNKNIYQITRNEKDTVDPLQTAGIYRIPLTHNNRQKFYIGVTKRKIKDRIKEHQADIKFNKNNTALAQLHNQENITINFNNTTKIADYNNTQYAYKREAIEIADENNAINHTDHAAVGEIWRKMLGARKRNDAHAHREKQERRRKREGEHLQFENDAVSIENVN